MGNTFKSVSPPPYDTALLANVPPSGGVKTAGKRSPDTTERADRPISHRALHAAVCAYAKSDNIESLDAVVAHCKTTIQELSAVVYGKRIKWSCVAAYVHTARELDPGWLVLPESYAAPFLENLDSTTGSPAP